MFSSRKATRLFTFAVFATILGGGLFAFVTGASTNADAAPVGAEAGIARNEIPYQPWSDALSPSALDAAGIEKDLDGNASALFPSDWLRAPGVR